MSSSKKRRTRSKESLVPQYNVHEQLPETCRQTFKNHINSIYVGSIVRIYDPSYKPEGMLVTVHWATDQGLFGTVHDRETCEFIDLKYKSWVVDHRCVRPGAFKLFARYGTNDIEDDTRNHTINEKRQKNSKILMNHTLMDFPTQEDRDTYNCCLFRLTCNCGCSKKAEIYRCSPNNQENGGKQYYACPDRYSNTEESCNYFVWQNEIEHGKFVKCDCGQLCKRININKREHSPTYIFVCVNRYNKIHPGCKVRKTA